VHDRFLKSCAQPVRAGKLTAQLLAFTGGQILEPRKLNLNLVIQEEMSLLSRIIGEGIKVSVQLAPDLPAILADASQIENSNPEHPGCPWLSVLYTHHRTKYAKRFALRITSPS
jgi:hypothetical protein